jgi:hypothetical protein
MPLFPSRNETTNAPNAIVGAARRVNLKRRSEVESIRDRSSSEWQNLAWRHFDEIGEIKFAFNYFSSIASRVRLFAGFQEEASDTPAPIGEVGNLDRSLVQAARYELAKLDKGRGGQPNLIRSMVINILVAGECYLVGDHDSWAIRSTSELEFEQGGKIRLRLSREKRKNTSDYLPDDTFVARIWRTHPQYSDDADSSLKGVSRACDELLLLDRIINAAGASKLNAGMLYVADELRFQASSDPTGDSTSPDIDPFEEELTLQLTESVEGNSPAELVPLIIRGPAGLAEQAIKYFDISRGFDETLLTRHDKTLGRVLSGLELPKDLIDGLANVRYSNAKSISEDLLKAFIEPMMVMVCEALTTVFLRPMLIDRGYPADVINRVHVWYDASEVVTRPDRSEDADKGYERMLIKGATWRRAHGFSESDAPSDEELALRIALGGQVDAATTVDFLRQVAPELVAEAEKLAKEAGHLPREETTSQPATGAPVVPFEPEPDPPEGELPPDSTGTATHSQKVMQMLAEFGAAKARVSPENRARTRKLERALDVERSLRDSLAVHFNDVIIRALEKAGARTVSKVRGNAELKSLVEDVPVDEVFSMIPRDRLTEFSLDDERKLVRDTIEKARTRFEDMVTNAQDQGWKTLGVLDEMKPKQKGLLARAWEWISDKLIDLAVGLLRAPKEDKINYVSMGLIRETTAIAGGATPGRVKPIESGRAVLSLDALQETTWGISGRYRWVHGLSNNIFEPHLLLDDTVFDSWDAPELATADPNEFPYVSHYAPGDHDGCRCDWLPVLQLARL